MKEYKVKWYISGSVGMPRYDGTETVYAENEDEAEKRAQREVHRRAFRDISIGRIQIVSVESVRK